MKYFFIIQFLAQDCHINDTNFYMIFPEFTRFSLEAHATNGTNFLYANWPAA